MEKKSTHNKNKRGQIFKMENGKWKMEKD